MSAWDQLNRDDPENGDGKDRQGDKGLDETPVSAWASEAADVEDAQVSRYDDHVIEAEESQAQTKPKKNLKPLLFAMGGVALLLVGGMGYVLMSLLSAPAPSSGISQAPAAIEQQMHMGMAAAPAEPVGMFAQSAAPAASSDAMGMDPAGQGAAQLGATTAAIQPAVLGGQGAATGDRSVGAQGGGEGVAQAALSTSAPAAAAAMVAGSSAADDGQRAELEKRLATMEGDIAEIKRKLDELSKSSRSAAAKPLRSASRSDGAAKPRASTSHQPRKVAATKDAAPAKDGEPSAPAGGAATAQAVAEGVEGLSLRAVNPPHGPDMQAWVMDGDRIMVVSRGSTIRGARVTSIELDRVVTDRGVIR